MSGSRDSIALYKRMLFWKHAIIPKIYTKQYRYVQIKKLNKKDSRKETNVVLIPINIIKNKNNKQFTKH